MRCMEPITIRKLDYQGRPIISYPGRVIERGKHVLVLRAVWTRASTDLGFVVLEPGDQWIEHFYSDRWYNIFEIHADDGRLKGWYCNITRPAEITSNQVSAEDLALDLWVSPVGSMKVLDEDEFARLPISAAERKAARSALRALQIRAVRHEPPFDRLSAAE